MNLNSAIQTATADLYRLPVPSPAVSGVPAVRSAARVTGCPMPGQHARARSRRLVPEALQPISAHLSANFNFTPDHRVRFTACASESCYFQKDE